MAVRGIVIREEKDNVAVVSDEVKQGDQVFCRVEGGMVEMTALEDIPAYHKISLADLKKGDIVVKYGEGIGKVTEDVRRGGYIHVHNLGLLEEGGI